MIKTSVETKLFHIYNILKHIFFYINLYFIIHIYFEIYTCKIIAYYHYIFFLMTFPLNLYIIS